MLLWSDAGKARADVVIEQDGDRLIVTSTYKRRRRDFKFNVTGVCVVGAALMLWFAFQRSVDEVIAVAFAAGLFLAYTVSRDSVRDNSESTLYVSGTSLSNPSLEVHLLRKEILKLEFLPGSKQHLPGLYANKSFWSRARILEYVSEPQAQRIIEIVHAYYPDGWKTT